MSEEEIATLDRLQKEPKERLRALLGVLSVKLQTQHADYDALDAKALTVVGFTLAVAAFTWPLGFESSDHGWLRAILAVASVVVVVLLVALWFAFLPLKRDVVDTFPKGEIIVQPSRLASEAELVRALAIACSRNAERHPKRMKRYRRLLLVAVVSIALSIGTASAARVF